MFFCLEAVVTNTKSWPDALGRLGADWWSVIVAGTATVLAVFDALPKIPW